MTEYNLDFFEAMAALKQGDIVTNDEYNNFRYSLKDGTISIKDINNNYSLCCEISEREIKAKWRIVEPEKCWLDKNYPEKTNPQYYAIRIAIYEAIKRIEAKQKQLLDTGSDAIEILKEMIGEK